MPTLNLIPGDLLEIVEPVYGLSKGDTGVFKGWNANRVAFEVQDSDTYNNHNYSDDGGGLISRDAEGYFNGISLDPRYVKKVARQLVDFDSVIIEDEKRDQILAALEQINAEKMIFEDWGFAETIEKGRGVSMLFHGPPGTGKTLMAQAIADKLDYRLKVISAADIQSSAPGQSERNIRQHFKSAGKRDILLFDECDSLIHTRSQVGAILGSQINELLTQIEKFKGITIFTTNRLGLLDDAVNRRLVLKLEFSMPNKEERAEIWKRMIPKKAPMAKDIDFDKLATVEIAGGYIKNAVLRAARMAAIEKPGKGKKRQITMDHMKKALKQEATAMVEFERARAEMEKTGKNPGLHFAPGRVIDQSVHALDEEEAHA